MQLNSIVFSTLLYLNIFQELSNYEEDLPEQKTELERLTEAAFFDTENKREVEKRIFDFFTEDKIIERTRNCKKYFETFITAQALVRNDTNVSEKELFIL